MGEERPQVDTDTMVCNKRGARQNQQIRWCRAHVLVKGLAQPCCTFDVEHGGTASAKICHQDSNIEGTATVVNQIAA